jgi:hypothetical protein
VLEDVAPEFAASPPAGGGSGAIFTTTPDGSIVNENVHYEFKREVYLDGGPPNNAPAHAAGLDEGYYVFQITDPPGKLLLSRDPARCRVVYVSGDGVITKLVPPTEVPGLGATTNNWADDDAKGQAAKFIGEPCHVPDPDEGEAGDNATTPDINGLGRHDTNVDVDHGVDASAIVVQMMPYGTTPNPGGVYKAWMTPLEAYVSVKGADLNDIPSQKTGRIRPHPCFDFCADADPGFVPSHRYTKTDNFKVEEAFTGEIKVRKFHDLNGNGIWDSGEPEIGVDQFLDDLTGDLSNTPGTDFGGWPFDYIEPGFAAQTEYTPFLDVIENPGTYSAEEFYLPGWTQTASRLDGVYDDPFQKKVEVTVTASGEIHEIVFGNFQLVDVTACKYEDFDGDGDKDQPIEGWTVHLTIDDKVVDTQLTGKDGCYTWKDLGPLPAGSYYDASETIADGWTATSPTEVDFESPPQSGASYKADFTNFENVEVKACKYEDFDGDGDKDKPIEGWTVHLTIDGEIEDTQKTGADGCYTWKDLGPLPAGSYYDASETVPDGWTATSPTKVEFESPPQSGAKYQADFTNFKNVKVKACKVKDADGLVMTTSDRYPIAGWTVYLTIDDAIVDEQVTGEDGCYTWTDLGPLPAGSYYDAAEATRDGWIALGAYDDDGNFIPHASQVDFESPPQSGAMYSAKFVNTPTQGCTPGFWQGGPDSPDPQSGGARLWDKPNDKDWKNSGGMGVNPYIHDTTFESFFGDPANVVPSNLTMFELVDTGGGSEDWRKLARDIVAAYLNASWGVAYAYTPDELKEIWTKASNEGTFLYWHNKIDAANNAPGGCPISAGGY